MITGITLKKKKGKTHTHTLGEITSNILSVMRNNKSVGEKLT
jgi:hypothetical protein